MQGVEVVGQTVLRVIGDVELQALLVAGPPLLALLAGYLLRLALRHIHNARVQACVARLVRWAQQAIPDKSARYNEVAGLLSARYPRLKGPDVEIAIESAVHNMKVEMQARPPASAVAAVMPQADAQRIGDVVSAAVAGGATAGSPSVAVASGPSTIANGHAPAELAAGG